MIDFRIGENLAQQFKRFQYFTDGEEKKCVISGILLRIIIILHFVRSEWFRNRKKKQIEI